VIARELGPQNFGIYSTVLSFVALFFIFTMPGLDRILVIEGSKNLDNLSHLFNENFFLKTKATTLSIFLCSFIAFFMPYSLEIKLLIVLFSFSTLFLSYTSYISSFLQAHEKMKEISFLRVLNSVLISSFSIICIYLGFNLFQLLSVIILAYALSLLSNYILYNKVKIKSINPQSLYSIKPAIIYSFISLLSIIIIRSDIIFISLFSTQTQVGLYAVPLALINKTAHVRNSFVIAFSPLTIKSIQKEGYILLDFIKLSFMIGFLFSLFFLVFRFFSSFIVSNLFGNIYLPSVPIIEVLFLSLIFSFGSLPFTQLLQAVNGENFILKSLITSVFFKIISLYFFFREFGIIGVAYSTVFVSIISYLFLMFSCIKISSSKSNKISI